MPPKLYPTIWNYAQKNHEPDFQEKFASFGGLDVQARKKKFVAKGKEKKTIP
jgi:hypothetical protein